jgi:hypothetical protein
VFSGTVTAIEVGGHDKVVTIRVDRAWKGVEAETVTVRTPSGDGPCGYAFQKDQAYLVYANRPEAEGDAKPQLHTNICTRTKPMADAKDDLAALGEGKRPAAKKE